MFLRYSISRDVPPFKSSWCVHAEVLQMLSYNSLSFSLQLFQPDNSTPTCFFLPGALNKFSLGLCSWITTVRKRLAFLHVTICARVLETFSSINSPSWPRRPSFSAAVVLGLFLMSPGHMLLMVTKLCHISLRVTNFVPFYWVFFFFFPEPIGIKCLLSFVSCLTADSLYNPLGLSLHPCFTSKAFTFPLCLSDWMLKFFNIYFSSLHLLNFQPNYLTWIFPFLKWKIFLRRHGTFLMCHHTEGIWRCTRVRLRGQAH